LKQANNYIQLNLKSSACYKCKVPKKAKRKKISAEEEAALLIEQDELLNKAKKASLSMA
jgi:hypothetical protein